MDKACVIGWPINHSRSPLIHNHWLKSYNIGGVFEKRAVQPQDLAKFVQSFPANEYLGCNITIPHKERAFSLVNIEDPATLKIGAVNTLYVHNKKVYGLNTDGMGFLANLKDHIPDWQTTGKNIIVIGAGGAARAIVATLAQSNPDKILILNRTKARAVKMAKEFGPGIHADSLDNFERSLEGLDLLINTTSLGMEGQPELKISLEGLPKTAVVADIVYSPLQTRLLYEAEQRGNRVVGGLGMLLHQAVPGFEKWFGIKPQVTKELYDLVVSDLRESSNQ